MAAAGYWLFEDNNVILPIFGAIFSIPCFQYIVGKPHLASSGRFVLLTFNLTCRQCDGGEAHPACLFV